MAFGRGDTETNPFGGAAPTAAAQAAVPGAADGDAPQRTARRIDRFLTLLFIVLSLGGTALVLVHEERKALDDPQQKAERGEVVGTDGFSLVNGTNLRRAFAVAQAKLQADEQITSLRVAPDRLDLLVRNTVGRQRSLQVQLDYEARATESGTSSSTGPRTLREVDAAAPERFVNAVLEREGYAPRTLDYLVYDFSLKRWSAYFKDVPIERNHFLADAHGGGARAPGDPEPATTTTPEAPQP